MFLSIRGTSCEVVGFVDLLRPAWHAQHSLLSMAQIRVFCRVRPSAAASAVTCRSDAVSLRLTTQDRKDHDFTFDYVFGPTATQDNVFAQVADVVQSALDGYNVCLFLNSWLMSLMHCCRYQVCRSLPDCTGVPFQLRPDWCGQDAHNARQQRDAAGHHTPLRAEGSCFA